MKELIRHILKEETNLKKTLQSSIERFGYFEVSKLIGGFDNLCNILELDLDDINTQVILVEDFIYFADIDEVEVDSIEVKNRANRKLIKVYIQTDSNVRNIESWYVRTIVDDMNNFFPFKVDVSWHPVNYPHSKIMIDASIGASVPFNID